jgi:hypothetical protein
MTTTVQMLDTAQVQRLSEDLVAFLETNVPPDGLFWPDVFCDLSLPQWRLQTDNAESVVQVRREGHPDLGRSPAGAPTPLRTNSSVSSRSAGRTPRARAGTPAK